MSGLRATRRGVLAGGLVSGVAGILAVPTLSGLAQHRWKHGEGQAVLHDPSLVAGQRFASAVAARGGSAMALEGDRIRLAQRVLAAKPGLIAGVSLGADALLIAEVAAEAGYRSVASLMGRTDSCRSAECQSGWQALGRLANNAGDQWIEALAEFALRPTGTLAAATLPVAAVPAMVSDSADVIGWVLAPRA